MNPFPFFSSAASRLRPCARIRSRSLPALAAAAWLALAAAGASASPIDFQANYLTLSGQNCVRAFCFPLTPGDTSQKTFSLDSSQLAVDGSYDVLASLAPAYPSIPGTTSLTLNATAFVAGGVVTDLVVHYSVSASNTVPIIGTTYTSNSFNASGGTWSSSSFTSNSLSNSSGNAAGTYTITQVPEPASLALASFGLVALAAARRPRRLSPYRADQPRGRSR